MKQTVNVWKYINFPIYKLLQASTIIDMGRSGDTIPLEMMKLRNFNMVIFRIMVRQMDHP